MNDNTILIPSVLLIVSVILGLFTPPPRNYRLLTEDLKYALGAVAVLGVIAILLVVDGSLDWAVTFGCAAESVFMLTVWLSAPSREDRMLVRQRHGYFGGGRGPGKSPSIAPVDWDEFGRDLSNWSRNGPRQPSDAER